MTQAMMIWVLGGMISGTILFCVLAIIWGSIQLYKIRYHNPKEIQELRAELERQAAIVNRLDAEGLDYIKKKSDEIAGQLRDITVSRALGR